MSNVAGFFVILNEERAIAFNTQFRGIFAEPVSEFTHPSNVPLICFIIEEYDSITHTGLGTKGFRAGTGLSRLNISDIFKLNKSLSAREIVNKVPSKFKQYLNERIIRGGLIASKSFEEFLDVFIKQAPDTAKVLNKYSKERRIRIEQLSDKVKNALAEQKEAVLTALNIAGIDKREGLGYDYFEKERPVSFLDGIKQFHQREDALINYDLTNFPGLRLIKEEPFSAAFFENENTHLTVILTNKQPLEELLGTDLIYYNEDFKCFVMVQYKMMTLENGNMEFRLPNVQLDKEISRMDKINNSLCSYKSNGHIDDFRFNNAPFFLKICPKIGFNPDDASLSEGKYIPLGYFKMIQNDKSIEGIRGGKAINNNNIRRYFSNTTFKAIVEGAWIGTNQNQSIIMEEIIRNVIENGKAAVIAVKRKQY